MKNVYRFLVAMGIVGIAASASNALVGGAVTYGAASYGGFSASLVGVEVETPFTNLPIPLVATRWAFQTGKSGTVTITPVTVSLAMKIPVTNIYGFVNTGLIFVSDTAVAGTVPGPFSFGAGVGYEYSIVPTASAFAQLGYQSATISTTIGGAAYSLNLTGTSYVVGLRMGL